MRSFLTWAFVLAEVVGKGVVPESAAKAAADEELTFGRALHDQDAVASDPSGSNAVRPALLDDLPEEAQGASGLHVRLPVVQAQDAVLQPEMHQTVAEPSTPLIAGGDGGGGYGDTEETELVSRPPQNPSAPDPTGSDPTGSTPAGSDPTGSDPTGSDPTGSDPTGSDPTGSTPTGSDPTGSGPTGSGPTGSDDAGVSVSADVGSLIGLDVSLGLTGSDDAGASVSANVGSLLGLDVSLGPTGSDDAGVSVSADVVSLVGFDVSLGPNGVFVGTEVSLEGVSSLGSELVNTVGSGATDLTHFLQGPLPGINALPELGSEVQTLASTLGEVTGLEVLGITTKSITDALLPSQPHDAVPDVAPQVDLPLTNVLNILPLTDAGIVSSGSIPIVAGADHLDQSDQLFAAGGHTEYGVTLQLNSVTADAAQGSANVIPAAVDLASAVVDVPHDVAADPASQALHLDELNLRSLSI